MGKKNYALCITRTCGSGGTEIGKMLAKQLGIDLYDRKLLRVASDDSGINEELFAKADQDTRKTILYKVSKSVYNGEKIPPESGNFLSDRNLFEFQARVLHGLLKKESFVVLGRAADFVLAEEPTAISIFLTASPEACFQREMELLQSDELAVNRHIRSINSYRSDYYKYHTGKKWKNVENYDLCLRTDTLGYQGCVDVIVNYLETRLGCKAARK
ncbi:MAG: cytidylate kinase-like family protein [Lachnospiraceae bacterium]|nr:cytidylate kinase-like family protein [Lachnospiraceae bacterium]MCD7833712.1 cytidylate kinase-like family protein [Lachnospiraceae bacterium]